jgi:hypothetical protein
MVTLITRPIPPPPFLGKTGAERAAARATWLANRNGEPKPTLETRQNFRATMRKAHKLARRQGKKA